MKRAGGTEASLFHHGPFPGGTFVSVGKLLRLVAAAQRVTEQGKWGEAAQQLHEGHKGQGRAAWKVERIYCLHWAPRTESANRSEVDSDRDVQPLPVGQLHLEDVPPLLLMPTVRSEYCFAVCVILLEKTYSHSSWRATLQAQTALLHSV